MSKPSDKFFQRRLNAALAKIGYGKTLAEKAQILSEACGVTAQAARKWLNGEGLPETSKLRTISKLLSVSIDYLMGRTTDPTLTKEIAPQGHDIVECNTNGFGGDIRIGDSLIIKPYSGSITNGSLYLFENNRIRRVWLEDQEVLHTNFTDDNGSHDETITGKSNISMYLTQLVGEIVAVIRRV